MCECVYAKSTQFDSTEFNLNWYLSLPPSHSLYVYINLLKFVHILYMALKYIYTRTHFSCLRVHKLMSLSLRFLYYSKCACENQFLFDYNFWICQFCQCHHHILVKFYTANGMTCQLQQQQSKQVRPYKNNNK